MEEKRRLSVDDYKEAQGIIERASYTALLEYCKKIVSEANTPKEINEAFTKYEKMMATFGALFANFDVFVSDDAYAKELVSKAKKALENRITAVD